MELIAALLICVQFISGVSMTESGILAFSKADTDISLNEIWENSDLTDRNSQYRHLFPVGKLLSDTYFRSQLIDRWSSLEVISAELILYNADKEYMGSYLFKGEYMDFLDQEFLQSNYLKSDENMIVETGLHYGPVIYIYKEDNAARFSFLAQNFRANVSPLNGNQFIISADRTFNYLTGANKSAEHVQCASIPVPHFITVENVFECTYHCLNVGSCTHYGLFTYINSSSFLKYHACVTLLGLPKFQKTECSYLCQDDWPCGSLYDIIPDSFATADVYKLDPEVTNELYDMMGTNIRYETEKYEIDEFHSVDLGEAVYISGLKITHGSGSFQLQLLLDSCIDMIDNSLQSVEHWYHGFNRSHITTFQVETPILFAPVLVRCLYFNSSDALMNKQVEIQHVKSKFLLAEYIAVHAEWNEPACSVMEVMSERDIIPDHAIDIVQFSPSNFDFSNGKAFAVPAVSHGYIDIILHDQNETWINSLEILVSVDVKMAIKYYTEKKCTNQINGKIEPAYLNDEISVDVDANTLYSEKFAGLKDNFLPAFCCESLILRVSAVDPHTKPTFEVAVTLNGFILKPGEIFPNPIPIGNLFDTHEVSAFVWFEPRPKYAYDVLRPGGDGLLIGTTMQDISITIWLNMDVDIPVASVELRGTLFFARVNVGGETSSGSRFSSDFVYIPFQNAAGRSVHIFDIQPYTSAVSTYINISVRIHACVITDGFHDDDALTTTLTTTHKPKFNTAQTGIDTLHPSFLTTPTILPNPIVTNINNVVPNTQIGNLFTTIASLVTPTTSYSHLIRTNSQGINVVASTTIHNHASATLPLVNIPATSSTTNNHSSSTDQATVSPTSTNAYTTTTIPFVNNQVTSEQTTTNAYITTKIPLVNSQVTDEQTTANAYTATTIPLVNNQVTGAPTTTNDYKTTTKHLSTTPISPNDNSMNHGITDLSTSDIVSSNQPNPQNSQETSTKQTTIPNGKSVTSSALTGQDTSQSGGENTPDNQPVTQSNTGGTPTEQGCICSNSSKNLTSVEIQEAVDEIVKNLTVPVKETSAFKRSKMSMPDKRRSSAVIGAVGVATMTTVFGTVVAMDAMHIVSAINFVKSIFIKG